MRLSVTAVVLACASCGMAQTTVGDTPVQKPMVMPQALGRRPPIKRAMPPGTAPASVKTPVVPPATAVVTLKGVCKQQLANTPCETVITREDLDRFVETSTPDAAKTAHGRQAIQYARTLAFSVLAEQQGLARNPALAKELDAQLSLVRMRILADAFLRNLQTQAPVVAQSDIEKYYNDHRDRYEQIQIRRLAVPFEVPTESGRHLERSAAKSEMAELRNRALAGEDLNQLQLEAYQHLHIQATPPPVNVLTLRRAGLQGDEARLFDLNAGEISAVLDLPAAFAVIKLESKDAMPIQSVRPEIEAELRRDGLQSEVGKRTRKISAQFNLQYFDMPSQPDIFGVTAAPPPATAANRP